MAEPGVVRRVIIPVVFLGLTVLGLLNTYGDAADVEKLAAQTACGGEMCPVQLREFSRSPFAHDYRYQVGKEGTQVSVRCSRAMIFVGAYKCEKK